MIGLPLSESTRAAALDGALSFSILVQNQRELTLSTAQSSVTGLLSAIQSAPAAYANLLTTTQTVIETQAASANQLIEPAWTSAPDATRTAIADSLNEFVSTAEEAETTIPATLAAAAGKSPTTFQLTSSAPPETYLTLWGDSGIISITDASGQGIFISPDGRVDTFPPSGEGWQFQNDSTFLLPDGTKISFSPGSPASVLATRGQQRLEITGIQSGTTPTAAYQQRGGLAADAARNDGHVFAMGSDPRAWTLSGAPLGEADDREIVATTALDHEVDVDVTKTTLPAALVAQLQELGINPADYDSNHDGALSSEELVKLVATLDAAIGGVQARFDAALKNTISALESLLRLNRFIEKILAESDRRQASKDQITAEERDQLRLVQRELESAHQQLRAAKTSEQASPTQPNVLTAARVVLNQIEHFGAEETTPTPSNLATPPSSPALPPQTDVVPNSLTQALRRAERLLSGLASGATPPRLQPAPLAPETLTRPLSPNAPSVDDSPSSPPSQLTTPLAPELGADPSPSPLSSTPAAPTPPLSGNRPPFNSPAPRPTDASSQSAPSPTDETNFPSSDAIIAPPRDASQSRSPAPGSGSSPFQPNSSSASQFAPPIPSPASSNDIAPPPARTESPSPVFSAPPDASFLEQTALPRPPSGQPVLPTTGFPATGPDTSSAPDPTFGSSDGFAREYRRRMDQHLGIHREHMARAQQLQTSVRQVVEQFLSLVTQDEQLRQVFNADALSDTQRATFKDKVEGLERELGLTWGGDPKRTPQNETNLNARVLNSGMMI